MSPLRAVHTHVVTELHDPSGVLLGTVEHLGGQAWLASSRCSVRLGVYPDPLTAAREVLSRCVNVRKVG